MNLSRSIVALLTAFAALGVVAAGGWIVTSSDLADARDEIESLHDRADAAEADLSVMSGDAARAQSRLKRLTDLLDAVRAEQRQLKRAGRGCFKLREGPTTDLRGPIKGDVDGDGSSDRVYTVGLASTKDRCRFYVMAQLASGEVVGAAIATQRHVLENDDLRFDLRPSEVVEVDGNPGQEVMIETGRGATGSSFLMFSLREGQLRELTKEEEGDRQFIVAASAGYGASWGCVSPAVIFETSFEAAAGNRYEGTTQIFRLVGDVFELVSTERFSVPYGERGLREINRLKPGSTRCSTST